MTGWLIYDQIGANRNEWFINEFIKVSKIYGVNLELKVVSAVDELKGNISPDFAIVRTINPPINKFLEDKKIATFNNYITSKIANDKFLTYQTCKKLNIPVMKTERIGDNITHNYPLVLKSVDGHGGTEVFLIKDQTALNKKLLTIDESNFIVQEFCSTPGIDMRVYVLGEQIIMSALRKSLTDFRSNFSLGGSASVCEVTPKQIEIINKLRKELNFDFVGVDFIYHNGDWVLNEIEDIVGTRMIYELTDINVVDLYIQYILEKLKRKA